MKNKSIFGTPKIQARHFGQGVEILPQAESVPYGGNLPRAESVFGMLNIKVTEISNTFIPRQATHCPGAYEVLNQFKTLSRVSNRFDTSWWLALVNLLGASNFTTNKTLKQKSAEVIAARNGRNPQPTNICRLELQARHCFDVVFNTKKQPCPIWDEVKRDITLETAKNEFRREFPPKARVTTLLGATI